MEFARIFEVKQQGAPMPMPIAPVTSKLRKGAEPPPPIASVIVPRTPPQRIPTPSTQSDEAGLVIDEETTVTEVRELVSRVDSPRPYKVTRPEPRRLPPTTPPPTRTLQHGQLVQPAPKAEHSHQFTQVEQRRVMVGQTQTILEPELPVKGQMRKIAEYPPSVGTTLVREPPLPPLQHSRSVEKLSHGVQTSEEITVSQMHEMVQTETPSQRIVRERSVPARLPRPMPVLSRVLHRAQQVLPPSTHDFCQVTEVEQRRVMVGETQTPLQPEPPVKAMQRKLAEHPAAIGVVAVRQAPLPPLQQSQSLDNVNRAMQATEEITTVQMQELVGEEPPREIIVRQRSEPARLPRPQPIRPVTMHRGQVVAPVPQRSAMEVTTEEQRRITVAETKAPIEPEPAVEGTLRKIAEHPAARGPAVVRTAAPLQLTQSAIDLREGMQTTEETTVTHTRELVTAESPKPYRKRDMSEPPRLPKPAAFRPAVLQYGQQVNPAREQLRREISTLEQRRIMSGNVQAPLRPLSPLVAQQRKLAEFPPAVGPALLRQPVPLIPQTDARRGEETTEEVSVAQTRELIQAPMAPRRPPTAPRRPQAGPVQPATLYRAQAIPAQQSANYHSVQEQHYAQVLTAQQQRSATPQEPIRAQVWPERHAIPIVEEQPPQRSQSSVSLHARTRLQEETVMAEMHDIVDVRAKLQPTPPRPHRPFAPSVAPAVILKATPIPYAERTELMREQEEYARVMEMTQQRVRGATMQAQIRAQSVPARQEEVRATEKAFIKPVQMPIVRMEAVQLRQPLPPTQMKAPQQTFYSQQRSMSTKSLQETSTYQRLMEGVVERLPPKSPRATSVQMPAPLTRHGKKHLMFFIALLLAARIVVTEKC